MSDIAPAVYTVEGLRVYSAYIDEYRGEIEEYQGKPCIFGRINPNKAIYVEYAWNMQGRNIRPGDEGPRNRHNLVGDEQLFREAFPSEID